MLAIIPIDEVLHNAPALENANRLAIGELIRQSRDAAVGIDLQEPGFFLCVLLERDFGHLVRETSSRC